MISRITTILIATASMLLLAATACYGLSAQEVYKKVNDAVYRVYSIDYVAHRRLASGSAVAVSKDILATNCHIVRRAHRLGIKIKKKIRRAILLSENRRRDVCLIAVPGFKFEPVTMLSTEKVTIGQDVYAIGNPEGIERSLSKGIVANRHKSGFGGYLLQTDLVVSHGSSGGGLFDDHGRLVGITTVAMRRNKNIAFAIPIEWINLALPQAEKKLQKLVKTNGIKQWLTRSKKKLTAKDKQLVKIASFDDDIAIYKLGGGCFFYFKTMPSGGRGSVVWTPMVAGLSLVFPGVVDVKQALQNMQQQIKTQRPKWSQDKSIVRMIVHRNIYQISDVNYPHGGYFELIANPGRLINQYTDFVIRYSTKDANDQYQKLNFSLYAMPKAMAIFKRDCLGVTNNQRKLIRTPRNFRDRFQLVPDAKQSD